MGQKMMGGTLKEKETLLDISAIPKGIYFLEIIDEAGSVVGKFIKE